jgi:large subunit ribosomal protein L21
MYAVIETGGKQYRVEVGTELEVELLDVEPGQSITLDRVLLVADGDESSIGRPVVADAAVSAEVVRQARGEKLISFKYRPKARSRVKKGHRQDLTILRITDVRLGKKSAADAARKAEADAKSERQRLEEAATRQAAADAELAAKLAKGAAAEKPKKAPAKAKPEAKADADAKADAKAGEPAKKTSTRTKASAAKADTKAAEAKPQKADAEKAAEAKPQKADAEKADQPAPKKTTRAKKDE